MCAGRGARGCGRGARGAGGHRKQQAADADEKVGEQGERARRGAVLGQHGREEVEEAKQSVGACERERDGPYGESPRREDAEDQEEDGGRRAGHGCLLEELDRRFRARAAAIGRRVAGVRLQVVAPRAAPRGEHAPAALVHLS